MRHDDFLCSCGIDFCECACRKCKDANARVDGLRHEHELQERLKKAGIDVGVLAELIWREIEPIIEARVDILVRAGVRRLLKKTRLFSESEFKIVESE